jgi:REP element-mobilizing transposase RayT
VVFHVLNRGNERRTIFESEGDYLAFLRVLSQTVEETPLRILAWCLMPGEKRGEVQLLTTAG